MTSTLCRAGHQLAVTAASTIDTADIRTQLYACAGCPIYQLALSPAPQTTSAADLGKANPTPSAAPGVPVTQLATRHALGIHVFDVTVTDAPPGERRGAKRAVPTSVLATLVPVWRLSSAGNMTQLTWNPYIPHELLYSRDDHALFSLLLPQTRAADASAGAQMSSTKRAHAAQVLQAAARALHRDVQKRSTDPVSVACAGGARKVFMAAGRYLHAGQVCIVSVQVVKVQSMVKIDACDKIVTKLLWRLELVVSLLACVTAARLQIRRSRSSARVQQWQVAFTLDGTERFAAIAAGDPSPRARSNKQAAHRARHIACHLLVACTTQRLLLFHAAQPTHVFLDAPLPPTLTQPACLTLNLWPLAARTEPVGACGSGGSEQATQAARERGIGLHASAEADTDSGNEGGSVCLGLASVTCRDTGQTVIQAFAALPAANGLTLCRSTGHPGAGGRQDDDSSDGRQSTGFLSQLGGLTAPNAAASGAQAQTPDNPRLQSVPAFSEPTSCKQPTPQADDGPSTSAATYARPANGECEIARKSWPWVLTSSASAVWLGAAQVVGASLRSLAAEAVSTADQCSKLECDLSDTVGGGGAAAMQAMLRDCPDNIGAALLVQSSNAAQAAGDELATVRAEEELQVNVLRAWAQGQDGGCHAALQWFAPRLHLVRATFHGSPVLTAFAWRTPSECARSRSQWAGVTVLDAQPTQRSRKARRKMAAGGTAKQQAFKLWSTPVATCTEQLQRWSSALSSTCNLDPDSTAAWTLPALSFAQSPEAAASDATQHLTPAAWNDETGQVLAWPFEHELLRQPEAHAEPEASALQVAVGYVLQALETVATVQEVLTAALAACTAAAAEAQQLQGRDARMCAPVASVP